MPKKDKNSSHDKLVNFMKNKKFGKKLRPQLHQPCDQSELTQEEEVAAAKKSSISKADKTDQSIMIRRLFLQEVSKFCIIITILVIAALAIIKGAPILIKSIHSLLSKLILGSA